jgi:hypothetical protein
MRMTGRIVGDFACNCLSALRDHCVRRCLAPLLPHGSRADRGTEGDGRYIAKKGGSQKLKDQNRWQLWLIIAANAVVFYGACQWETFEISGLKAALAGAANLLPVGLAIVVTTVANGLLTSHADCVPWAFGTSLLHRPYPGRTALPNG